MRIRPGMEPEVERWMQMLNDRVGEAVRTLERERTAIELAFRDGDSLVWVMVQGERGGSIGDSPFEIDAEHVGFIERCVLPGGPEAEPQLLLLPDPVREAVMRWALPE
jgi:hypothetical protein